jgi:hypothetical protein
MDLDKLIGELYAERMRLDAAIGALERAMLAGEKRRGRPPKWLAKVRSEQTRQEPKSSLENRETAKK